MAHEKGCKRHWNDEQRGWKLHTWGIYYDYVWHRLYTCCCIRFDTMSPYIVDGPRCSVCVRAIELICCLRWQNRKSTNLKYNSLQGSKCVDTVFYLCIHLNFPPFSYFRKMMFGWKGNGRRDGLLAMFGGQVSLWIVESNESGGRLINILAKFSECLVQHT